MTIRASAAVARIPAGQFTIEPIDIDEPRPDEILVRLAGVGVCHTDLAFAAHLQIMRPPAILGHEGSGIVERVGSRVTKVQPGDHVVLTFNSCGHCRRCDEGKPAYCFSFPQMNYSGSRVDGSAPITVNGEPAAANFFGQSSFASFAIATERNVVPIDASVPIELMGPLGCGIQTGAGAIMNSLACGPGSSLLILGGGAVGLSAVLGAVIQQCSTIIVVEPKPARRALALELGATHVIDSGSEDVAARVRAIIPPGVDYAFDTSGLRAVIHGAIQCLAPNAKFGLVGIPPNPDDSLEVPMNLIVGAGYSFIGIIEGDSEPDQFIPRLVALYREGRFPFDRLITTYRLDEINLAIADHHSGKCVKPVLLPR